MRFSGSNFPQDELFLKIVFLPGNSGVRSKASKLMDKYELILPERHRNNSSVEQASNILTADSYLTLTVLNFSKFTSYCSLKPLWSGMGEVVLARTSPTLHPPSPPTVH